MEPAQALAEVRRKFPFPGYMNNHPRAYLDAAATLRRHLPPGAKVLDFGSGPCDKTAVLQTCGFACSAYDDLQDHWHTLGDNRQKIIDFARGVGIDFRLAEGGPLPFDKESFDAVVLEAVIEHLHDSPRDLLNDLVELLRPEGLLYITVPSAVNVRKRMHVLLGKTNYPRYATYYWYPGPWRGHVREYTRGDLQLLAQFLGLEVLELRGCHHMLLRLSRAVLPVYLAVTALFPNFRDSWLLLARRPRDWRPRRSLTDEELGKVLGTATPYQY